MTNQHFILCVLLVVFCALANREPTAPSCEQRPVVQKDRPEQGLRHCLSVVSFLVLTLSPWIVFVWLFWSSH